MQPATGERRCPCSNRSLGNHRGIRPRMAHRRRGRRGRHRRGAGPPWPAARDCRRGHREPLHRRDTRSGRSSTAPPQTRPSHRAQPGRTTRPPPATTRPPCPEGGRCLVHGASRDAHSTRIRAGAPPFLRWSGSHLRRRARAERRRPAAHAAGPHRHGAQRNHHRAHTTPQGGRAALVAYNWRNYGQICRVARHNYATSAATDTSTGEFAVPFTHGRWARRNRQSARTSDAGGSLGCPYWCTRLATHSPCVVRSKPNRVPAPAARRHRASQAAACLSARATRSPMARETSTTWSPQPSWKSPPMSSARGSAGSAITRISR